MPPKDTMISIPPKSSTDVNGSSDRPKIPDVQGRPDTRGVAIDRVGISGVKLPIRVSDRGGQAEPTVGTFKLTVALPPEVKGTHMSRFLELLHEEEDHVISVENMQALLPDMNARLKAETGEIQVHFPWFISKPAPITGTESKVDYEVIIEGTQTADGYTQTVEVKVPITTLCPCSKTISDYGAHNQRGIVSVRYEAREHVWFEEIIEMVEAQGSCEVFGILKRPDEKLVTERAYENPKFVEDVVRDVALELRADARIARFEIEIENFESIHNHQAYAKLQGE